CLNHLNLSARFDLDAGGALILDDHPPREAVDEAHILTLQGRTQISVGGGPAPAVVDGLLHRAETFLPGAVIVLRRLEAGLPSGLDEGGVERVALRAAPHVQRSVVAAPAVLAALRVFHALEIGQYVGVAPARRSLLGPVVEVAGVAAHIDHAVDRGR